MATNIPPHNLGEVIDAVVATIDDPAIEVEGLMRHIKAPDFPTGGIIVGRAGVVDAYRTGRGRIVVRGRAHNEPLKHGRNAIVFTELPYQVNKAELIRKMADLANDKVIPEISDLRDESGRDGVRVVIELRRDAVPMVVLNKLYKHTATQTTFGVNAIALVDGVPRTLGLKDLIRHYIAHQKEVVTRRSRFRLARAEARAHILEGLLKALEHLDEVIALIRGAADPETARNGLMSRFDLTEIQARAILDLRLQRLTQLEAGKIQAEYEELQGRIAELRAILGDERRVYALIREELLEIRGRYADERRTEIVPGEGDIDLEDLIAEEEMVISISNARLREAPAGDAPTAPRAAAARGCAASASRTTTTSSTCSSPRRTTTCSSSRTSARSTARRSTSCPRARATPAAGTSPTSSPSGRARRCAPSSPRATTARAGTWSSPPATAW